MHIYFSGIGGSGIGPLAMIAKQAGYQVSGSDKQDSQYVQYLKDHGIEDIHIGQETAAIAAVHAKSPIDWFVYSSALPRENPNHPELLFCESENIHVSKRDELLNKLLTDLNLQLIAIAGTHGKTTLTAMTVWACKSLGVPVSYLLPAKTSFADMGHYEHGSKYFIYEADEYDRNFLAYQPQYSVITGIDWDHPDVYPTRDEYYDAFKQFIGQSQHTLLWRIDSDRIGLTTLDACSIADDTAAEIEKFTLAGLVNRQNAYQVALALTEITGKSFEELVTILNSFPGVSRRFEKLATNIFTDYAHTIPKIKGALQLGQEVAGDNLVVVYEGLHNTRQHFIKDALVDVFSPAKKLYIVPSYLAREDPNLALLTPNDLKALMDPSIQSRTVASELNDTLLTSITEHARAGDTVLCISAGGGGSLDEFLRQNVSQ